MPKEDLGFAVVSSFARVFAGVLGFCFAIVVVLVLLGGLASLGEVDESSPLEFTTVYGSDESENILASIVIDGIILGERTSDDVWTSLAEDSVTYGYEVKAQLMRLAEQDDVAGVLLELHSPGGTIFGTQAIVDGVAYYQETTGKPVYAFVGSLAASGGYWAAISADQVYADAGTAVGSIGVLSGPFKFYDGVISEDGGAFLGGIVTTQGIETSYITAGAYKDLGNPFRPMSPEEIAVLQQSVDGAYQDFVEYIGQRRQLNPQLIRERIGALIYDEQQALQLGLIDQTANWHVVVADLASQAGLSPDDYRVARVNHSVTWLDTMLESHWLRQPKQTVSACPWQATALVYHGDVAGVCQSLSTLQFK